MSVLRDTFSVCPVCLRKIPAVLISVPEAVVMKKTCPLHGTFSVPVWRNRMPFAEWTSREMPLTEEESGQCSGNCRTCTGHHQDTCCVLLEITSRCSLRCAFCFADGGNLDRPTGRAEGFEDRCPKPRNAACVEECTDGRPKSRASACEEEPSFLALCSRIDEIVQLAGSPLLQFSGGEPTLRDDLPALVRYAKEAGCAFTQVNTNGLRLASDEEYVKSLAEAGLDIVFLQFDGMDDDIYTALRGRPLFAVKEEAIHLCAKYHIGVTLVPTVVRGINEQALGDIVRYAAAHFPAVRGVHFQPVTYLGRIPEASSLSAEGRYTLDELVEDLCEESGIPENVFLPSRCDHALCGFHATFLVTESGQLHGLTDRGTTRAAKNPRPARAQSEPFGRTCSSEQSWDRTSAQQNRTFIGTHWRRNDAEVSLDASTSSPNDPAKGWCPHSRGPIGTQHSENTGQQKKLQTESLSLYTESLPEMDFDTFLRSMKTRTLTVSAMAFQDAMNLNLERLFRCSLHVYENHRLLPFCAHYLTPMPEAQARRDPACCLHFDVRSAEASVSSAQANPGDARPC